MAASMHVHAYSWKNFPQDLVQFASGNDAIFPNARNDTTNDYYMFVNIVCKVHYSNKVREQALQAGQSDWCQFKCRTSAEKEAIWKQLER